LVRLSLAPPTALKNLEWKVQLYLLVLVRVPRGIVPMGKPAKVSPAPLSPQENNQQSWAAFFALSIIGPSMERVFHDGDEVEERDADGDEEDERRYDWA
jgi:hypothetical protein